MQQNLLFVDTLKNEYNKLTDIFFYPESPFISQNYMFHSQKGAHLYLIRE